MQLTSVSFRAPSSCASVSLSLASPLKMRFNPMRSKRHHFASSSSSVSCRAAKKVHTVQKGEWLSSIAPQYGVTTEQLAKENKALIGQGDMIFPGDQLKIPTVGGSGIKGVLVKITVALLIVAAASGIWPTIKEQMDEK